MCPYNPNIPQASDQIKYSQDDLLNDFQSINTLFQVDHSAFEGANAGKHDKMRFPIQGVSPSTAVNEIALFSRISQNPVGFGNVLCLRNPNNGSVTEFSALLNNASGWTRFPNSMLVKWQTFSFGANPTGSFPFVWDVAGNIPAFSNPTPFICVQPKQNGNQITKIISILNGSVTDLGMTLWAETTTNIGSTPAFDVYVIAFGLG